MTTTWRTSAWAAVAALALGAGSVSAQFSGMVGSDEAVDAAAIEEQARQAMEDRSEWGQASILFRQAADLRTDDPIAADNYRWAGLLAFYAGREGRAIDDLTRAAETALAWGDVSAAARSFLDAAWIAHREGDDARTLELARKGERLAHSPLLSRGEQALLLDRIADGDRVTDGFPAPPIPSH